MINKQIDDTKFVKIRNTDDNFYIITPSVLFEITHDYDTIETLDEPTKRLLKTLHIFERSDFEYNYKVADFSVDLFLSSPAEMQKCKWEINGTLFDGKLLKGCLEKHAVVYICDEHPHQIVVESVSYQYRVLILPINGKGTK